MSVPLFDEALTTRAELDAKWPSYPLIVLWGSSGAGDAVNVKVSINDRRLECELARVAPHLLTSARTWDEVVQNARKALNEFAKNFISEVISEGMAFPGCLSKDARAVLRGMPAGSSLSNLRIH